MSKESGSVRFLYNTALGRLLLKIMVCPWVSNVARVFLVSPLSKPMIGRFIKKHKINISDYEDCKYKSFNDFFIRNKKTVVMEGTYTDFVSPCDGYLTVYPIDETSVFKIKNSCYDVKSLLDDEELAKKYQGGMCFIFRLMPHHFHRYSFTDDGMVKSSKTIDGILHCVRPIACERFPVYIQNKREYTEIETAHFGSVIQMEVGAIIVGRINNHQNAVDVKRGQEKGYFEFGGSTIIMLTQKDVLSVDKDLLEKSENGIETDVKIGNIVAKKML